MDSIEIKKKWVRNYPIFGNLFGCIINPLVPVPKHQLLMTFNISLFVSVTSPAELAIMSFLKGHTLRALVYGLIY